MSKITQEKKELKGKQKKIAESEVKKASENSQTSNSKTSTSMPNYGCCCTCAYFPKHVKGIAQPCKVSGKYVARKAKFECYKCGK